MHFAQKQFFYFLFRVISLLFHVFRHKINTLSKNSFFEFLYNSRKHKMHFLNIKPQKISLLINLSSEINVTFYLQSQFLVVPLTDTFVETEHR